MRECAPYLLEGDILGSSCGSLMAIFLAAGFPMEEIVRATLHISTLVAEASIGALTPGFNFSAILKEIGETILPEDIAEKINGRCHISMTKVPGFSNMLVSEFASKSDVIDALLCTSYVPYLFGWFPPKFRGIPCIDGFYSNNQPITCDETIAVTAFAGVASIRPFDGDEASKLTKLGFPQGPNASLDITWNNFMRFMMTCVPPAGEISLKNCMRGYEDGIKYLRSNNLIKCAQCISSSSMKATCSLCETAKNESLTKPFPKEILKMFKEATEKEKTSYVVSAWRKTFKFEI